MMNSLTVTTFKAIAILLLYVNLGVDLTTGNGRGASCFGTNIAYVISGKDYERIYDKVNEHLEGFEDKDDAESDMEAAIRWLESESSAGSLRKSALKGVLNQLKDLKAIQNDERCDRQSYEVLRANNLGARGRPKNLEVFNKQFRRIDKLVGYYLDKHAESCEDIHPKLIKTKISTLDEQKVKLVRKFAIGCIEGKRRRLINGEWRWKEISDEDFDSHLSDMDGNAVYEVDLVDSTKFHSLDVMINPIVPLRSLAQGDPDSECLMQNKNSTLESGKSGVQKGLVEALFRKYMLEPCKYYVQELSNLIQIAGYDTARIKVADGMRKGVKVGCRVEAAALMLCRLVIDRQGRKRYLNKIVEQLRAGKPDHIFY